MATSNSTLHSATTYAPDPTTPNTTFVQADPSNFRAVVQKLTGASDDPSAPKLPLTLPSRLASTATAAALIGPKKPNFKLHERRNAAAKKLDLSIGAADRAMAAAAGMMMMTTTSSTTTTTTTSTTSLSPSTRHNMVHNMVMMASPVSPLELLARGSPRTPRVEEEEKAIAEKGFYLHPSPLSTPRPSQPPQLLTLFPLHSPSHTNS